MRANKLLAAALIILAGCASRKPQVPQIAPGPPDQDSVYIAYAREMNQVDRNFKAYYHYSLARWAFMQGDLFKAIEEYKQASEYASPDQFPYQEVAEVYIRIGDYNAALQQIELALKANPKNADAWMERGVLMEINNDLDSAADSYDRCYGLDPDMVDCRMFQAQILNERGDTDRAFSLLDELAKKRPDLLDARLLLARICLQTGRNDRAREEFSAVLIADPENFGAALGLGLLAEDEGRDDQAVGFYRTALDQDPGNSSLRDRLILLLVRQGRAQEALDEADRIRTIDADEHGWRVTRGMILSSTGRPDEAEGLLRQAVSEKPDDDYARLLLAGLLIDTGRSEEALELVHQVPRGSDYFPEALGLKVEALRRLYRWEEALEAASMGRSLQPQNLAWLRTESMCMAALGRCDPAADLLLSALHDDPKDIDLLYALALVYEKCDDDERAISVAKNMLRIDPENAGALNFLGYTYAEMGVKLDEAEMMLLKAQSLRPEDGYIRDSLGWLYYKKQDYGKAVMHLEEAARLAPNEAVILDHLGDAYQAVGSLPSAAEAYNRALAANPEPELRQELLLKIESLGANPGPGSGR